jgi:hypothetical protein
MGIPDDPVIGSQGEQVTVAAVRPAVVVPAAQQV